MGFRAWRVHGSELWDSAGGLQLRALGSSLGVGAQAG